MNIKYLVLSLLLMPGNISTADEFTVRIVDEERAPVPSISISSFWGFNGPFPTRNIDDSELEELWLKRYRSLIHAQMGQPFPEGKCSVTDRGGCASVSLFGRAAAIAYSQDKSDGALLYPTEETSLETTLVA